MSLISIQAETPREIARRSKEMLEKSTFGEPSFAIYTLGCKVNQAESHQIAQMLQASGFRKVQFRESADLYVINTCTVTSEANRKSRKVAARAHRNNPDALVAVTGCAASYGTEQFLRAAPGALVLGNTRKMELPELAIAKLRENAEWAQQYADLRAQTGSEPVPIATRERGVIKMQDGCNHNCSYCIIPTVRGASVQKTRETILEEAHRLLDEGVSEITLTGVSMGDWGRRPHHRDPRGRNAVLCDLLREVADLPGLGQLRVSSLDPADVDEEFLETIAHYPKICPHIHLALQSGAASTLRRMRRRYTPQLYLKWAQRWREIRPDGGLTTDVIVGFPGETDEEFEESMEVARQAKFSHMHVFPYSAREGTVASDFPDKVDPMVQRERVKRLIALGDELAQEYATQFIGKVLSVLIERKARQGMQGLIPQYIRAHIPENESVNPGDIVNIRVSSARGGELHGEII